MSQHEENVKCLYQKLITGSYNTVLIPTELQDGTPVNVIAVHDPITHDSVPLALFINDTIFDMIKTPANTTVADMSEEDWDRITTPIMFNTDEFNI